MPSNRSWIRLLEGTLAGGLLVLIALTVGLIPGVSLLEDTLGTVSLPEWLELAILFTPPTALAVVALARTVLIGMSVGGLLTAGLAVLTLALILWSIAAVIVPTEGGVFFGHILVGMAAIPLAVVALVRPLVDHLVHDELTPRLRSRFGH